jgi:hypothetical protein
LAESSHLPANLMAGRAASRGIGLGRGSIFSDSQNRLPNDALSGATHLPPCALSGTPPYQCGVTGNENLRYFSITFQYQTKAPSDTSQYYIANPDGIAPLNADAPMSLVSLADTAFATKSVLCDPWCSSVRYVNLIVNLGGILPSWLQYSPSTGVTQGVMPVSSNGTLYSVWQVQGYTVLDLTQFPGYQDVLSMQLPLQMNIRTTLPNGSFTCAGQAVPFGMAQYTNWDTNGGGLMGPYVPLVSYVHPNSLPQAAPVPQLPSATPCTGSGGVPTTNAFLSNHAPSYNQPSSSAPWNYPVQYFGSGSTNDLNCGPASPNTPVIDVVASEVPYPADYYTTTCPTGATCAMNCQNGWNGAGAINCTQIIAQPTQTTENAGQLAWQPPVPMTITGSGFGYLPWGAPVAVSANGSFPLDIQDSTGWDTASSPACQMYITEWSDSKISLVLSEADRRSRSAYQAAEQPINTFLSPVTDVSPWMFTAAATACPVNVGDVLTIKVTNPQTNVVSPMPATVTRLSVDRLAVLSPAGYRGGTPSGVGPRGTRRRHRQGRTAASCHKGCPPNPGPRSPPARRRPSRRPRSCTAPCNCLRRPARTRRRSRNAPQSPGPPTEVDVVP